MRPSFKNTDYKPSAKKTESFKQWESKNNITKNWDTPEQIFIKPAYGVEDLQNMEHLNYAAGIPPFFRGPYSAMYAMQPRWKSSQTLT